MAPQGLIDDRPTYIYQGKNKSIPPEKGVLIIPSLIDIKIRDKLYRGGINWGRGPTLNYNNRGVNTRRGL
jgi:hypothetical protein